MSFTEINRACEAILDRHQSRENSSYLKYRLTPDAKRRLMDQGLIGYKPPPRPMSYEKKTDIRRGAGKFTLEQIKTKLAVIEEMRAEGMTVLEACSLAGISQGNLHRWQKKLIDEKDGNVSPKMLELLQQRTPNMAKKLEAEQ